MANARRRYFPKEVVDRVKAQLDHIPRTQIDEIVAALSQELWLRELYKNPRIMALAHMKVGQRINWWHADARGYMQSADKQRARAVMDEPQANWRLHRSDGMPRGLYRVERIA